MCITRERLLLVLGACCVSRNFAIKPVSNLPRDTTPSSLPCTTVRRGNWLCHREKREYKYVVKDKNGVLKSWQPGENCAVEVPSEVDASLQVADDWFGKSRSVIYKNGEVQTAPAGTFDGPPAQASTTIEPPAPVPQSISPIPQSISDSSSQIQTIGEPCRGFFDVSSPPAQAQATVSPPIAQASGWRTVDEPVAKLEESSVESTLVDDETGVPFKELPVKTLQKRLRGRKQKASGKKVDLVERLQSTES